MQDFARAFQKTSLKIVRLTTEVLWELRCWLVHVSIGTAGEQHVDHVG
jgi:hypothetical protein